MTSNRTAGSDRDSIQMLAFTATTAGMVVTDPTLPDNPIVDANPAFERMTGYSREEVIGRNCRFLQGPGTDPATIGRIADAVRAERESVETLLNYRKDGTPFWQELRITPVRDRDGGVAYFVGVQADITARVEAETALREHADHLEAIIETQADVARSGPSPEAVMRLVVARARALTAAEGAGIAFAEGDDVVYRVTSGIVAPQEGVRHPVAASLTGLCLRTGDVVLSGDAMGDQRASPGAARADGIRSLLLVPLRHETEVVGVLGVSSPRPRAFGERETRLLRLLAGLVGASLVHAAAFAAMRDAVEAAEAASRAKSVFLSTMSHELRTPLNAVLGYAHLLLDGLDGELDPRQATDVEHIADGAERLLRLVDDILDLTRIEAGRLEVTPEPVDLAGMAAEIWNDVALPAAAKGLDLRVDVPATLPPVLADPLRLRQILTNLVGNAVKFTERGYVAVSATASGDGTVDIAVADTGVGIAPEALPHVFDEFRQADGSTTRRYGGSGLGLAIARRLAELHDGAILAQSEPGVGSVFTLVMPVARHDVAVTQDTASPADPHGIRSLLPLDRMMGG